MVKILEGKCEEVLKDFPDNYFDSIVTDPPYGLRFMGKKWDYNVPSIEQWQEALRVLKPGGYLLSFGGTRTYHRMVVNIEDAGFEIRDQIQWLYGSGFPKSLDVGKAIDKVQGNEREVVGKIAQPGSTNKRLAMGDGWQKEPDLTEGNTQWEGFGTALKPANEPICLARKPLSEKTVAANVLKWGTGGLNIDGGRIGTEGGTEKGSKPIGKSKGIYGEGLHGACEINELNKGRFPANVILTYPEDEYILKENVTSTQLRSLAEWMDANP